MITRSKLVDQLRVYQIRTQHKWPALTVFSPKPILSTRTDVAVSIFWALLFIVLLVSSYSTLCLKCYWISFIIMCLGILIPIRLRILRQSLARKRDRRLLLPLSIGFASWEANSVIDLLTANIGRALSGPFLVEFIPEQSRVAGARYNDELALSLK